MPELDQALWEEHWAVETYIVRALRAQHDGANGMMLEDAIEKLLNAHAEVNRLNRPLDLVAPTT